MSKWLCRCKQIGYNQYFSENISSDNVKRVAHDDKPEIYHPNLQLPPALPRFTVSFSQAATSIDEK